MQKLCSSFLLQELNTGFTGSQGVSHNRFGLNIFDDPLLHNEIDQAFNSGAEFGGFYTHSHWEMNANEIWTMSENSTFLAC